MATLFHPEPGSITVDCKDGLVIAGNGQGPRWIVDGEEDPAVLIALDNLKDDLEAVAGTGPGPSLPAGDGGATICVGTLGRSAPLDAAVAARRLDVAPLNEKEGTLRWEGFTLQVRNDTLYIAGTDRRGTVYGIYTLSQAMGVSPLHWWADVPPRRRPFVSIPRDLCVYDWPSVKYRGFFINDEEELDDWARSHTADGTIGPVTYEHVFDLILRLRGNYLWPAMHVNAFNSDPRNGRLAQTMGLVIGSSHCDMLLRSNQHEWDPWVKAQGEPVAYDYSLPGRNRDKIREYWAQSVDMNRDYEVTWTVGMRGIHDTGLTTRVIDEDPGLDDEGRVKARVGLMEKIIADQRSILADHLGRNPESIPQIFIPYKEVLPLYDAGLKVPDDVTIMWVNDNYGYMRRFPDRAEAARSGGNGVYYHSSYWAPPRTSYRCTSSTPLALMRDQLVKCWDSGIRRVWVDNLGAVKRLELEGSYFLHLAWNAGRAASCLQARDFVARWFEQTFGSTCGQEAADLCMAYYAINNETKIEHFHECSFAQSGYGDEAGARLAAIMDLDARSLRLEESLDPRLRESYAELIGFKIALMHYVCAQFYHADRSRLDYARRAYRAADRQTEISHLYGCEIRALVHWYNRVLAGGKWEDIFTPDTFPPPTLPQHPTCRPSPVAWIRGTQAGVGHAGPCHPASSSGPAGVVPAVPPDRDASSLAVCVEGEDGVFSLGALSWSFDACAPPANSSSDTFSPLPAGSSAGQPSHGHRPPVLSFDPYGSSDKWLDLYALGSANERCRLRADQDWVHLSCSQVTVADEVRVHVMIDDPPRHAGSRAALTITAIPVRDGVQPEAGKVVGRRGVVSIQLGAVPGLDPGFIGYVEADGFISMDPSTGLTRPDPSGSGSWLATADLGRFANPLMQTVGGGARDVRNAALLSLDFWLMTAGAHTLEIHRLPTLDSRGRIRLRVCVDGIEAGIVESPTTDEFRGNWQDSIVENSERLTLVLPHLDAGPHRLDLRAMDRSFGIDKVVIYTRPRRAGHLGPSFSTRLTAGSHLPAVQHGPHEGEGSKGRDHPDFSGWPGPASGFQPCPSRRDLDDRLRLMAVRGYGIDLDDLPPEAVAYFDRSYWAQAGLYTRPNLVYPSSVKRSGRCGTISAAKADDHPGSCPRTGSIHEVQGRIAIEVADCLAGGRRAWLSPGGVPGVGWFHTDAPIRSGLGMAMRAEPAGSVCEDPWTAPRMTFAFDLARPGVYRLWILAQFASDLEDSCHLFMDGSLLDSACVFPPGGHLMTYATEHVWAWFELAQVELREGGHRLGIAPHRAGMKISRIYLAEDGIRPPVDRDWPLPA